MARKKEYVMVAIEFRKEKKAIFVAFVGTVVGLILTNFAEYLDGYPKPEFNIYFSIAKNIVILPASVTVLIYLFWNYLLCNLLVMDRITLFQAFLLCPIVLILVF